MASIVLPEGIQLLSGLEANRTSVIPDVAEPLIATDTGKLYYGDNATAGGLPIQVGLENDAVPQSTGGDFAGSIGVKPATGDALVDVQGNGTNATLSLAGANAFVTLRANGAPADSRLWYQYAAASDGTMFWAARKDDGSPDVNAMRLFHHAGDDAKGGFTIGDISVDPGFGWIDARNGFKNLGTDIREWQIPATNLVMATTTPTVPIAWPALVADAYEVLLRAQYVNTGGTDATVSFAVMDDAGTGLLAQYTFIGQQAAGQQARATAVVPRTGTALDFRDNSVGMSVNHLRVLAYR